MPGSSLKLGGRGSNFLKQEARELLMSDDETPEVPKIISGSDPVKEANVRSILKSSPQKTTGATSGQDSKPKKTLRVNSESDSTNRTDTEKRIQFHIEEKPPLKLEKMEPSVETTSDEVCIL